MSLTVYLENEAGEEIYSSNITHNLGKMASEAGIYECLWRPEEHDITYAHQIIESLEAGVALLATQKARFEKFNSPNGWGKYEHFVPFVENYLNACKEYPNAIVGGCR